MNGFLYNNNFFLKKVQILFNFDWKRINLLNLLSYCFSLPLLLGTILTFDSPRRWYSNLISCYYQCGRPLSSTTGPQDLTTYINCCQMVGHYRTMTFAFAMVYNVRINAGSLMNSSLSHHFHFSTIFLFYFYKHFSTLYFVCLLFFLVVKFHSSLWGLRSSSDLKGKNIFPLDIYLTKFY